MDRATAERPIELRVADEDDDLFHPKKKPPRRMVWLRAIAPLADDPALSRHPGLAAALERRVGMEERAALAKN